MTTWILNSAVLPAGAYGTYQYSSATWADVAAALRAPHTSRVGYEQTAELVERRTGVRPAISREPSVLAPGDKAYVVRLRYRVDPRTKGAHVGEDDGDWEVALLERLPRLRLTVPRTTAFEVADKNGNVYYTPTPRGDAPSLVISGAAPSAAP